MKKRYIKPELEIVEFEPLETTNMVNGSDPTNEIPSDKATENFGNMF